MRDIVRATPRGQSIQLARERTPSRRWVDHTSIRKLRDGLRRLPCTCSMARDRRPARSTADWHYVGTTRFLGEANVDLSA
jgi:hypothetical protein